MFAAIDIYYLPGDTFLLRKPVNSLGQIIKGRVFFKRHNIFHFIIMRKAGRRVGRGNHGSGADTVHPDMAAQRDCRHLRKISKRFFGKQVGEMAYLVLRYVGVQNIYYACGRIFAKNFCKGLGKEKRCLEIYVELAVEQGFIGF